MLKHTVFAKGNGYDWLVLLHGITGNSNIWYKQVDEYRKHFNVLLVDLPGHGENDIKLSKIKRPTLDMIGNHVIDVMNHLKISRAHFVGISLGTIVINSIICLKPHRVISAVYGGSVSKLRFKAKSLLWVSAVANLFLPYKWLQPIAAFAMMPKNNHKKSRDIFIREGRLMERKELSSWIGVIRKYSATGLDRTRKSNIPKLFIMGSEDYMFLDQAVKDVGMDENATLHIIEGCGHVCNIEGYVEFNEVSIQYMKDYTFAEFEDVV